MAGIQLIAEIEPKNSGSFALLDDKYLRGGLRVVETVDELSSIPTDRLKDGCLSMITTPSRVLYVYDKNLDTWEPFSSGGGGGGSDWLCVEDGETTKLIKDVDTWTQKVVVINHIRTYSDYFALPTEYVQNNEVAYCKTDVMEGTTTYKKGLYYYDLATTSWIEVNSSIEIDSALSDTSKRPVQNRVVTRALEEKVSKDDVDNVISRFSENPIQNKAVATALENIKNSRTMTTEEYEALDDETKNDGSFYYISDTGEIYQNGIIYGGKQIFDVTQEEYDALTDEEKSNNEYHCTDTGRTYINGILYGDKKPIELTYEEYKQLEADGLVEPDVDYIIVGNESGVLLGSEDISYKDKTVHETLVTLEENVTTLETDVTTKQENIFKKHILNVRAGEANRYVLLASCKVSNLSLHNEPFVLSGVMGENNNANKPLFEVSVGFRTYTTGDTIFTGYINKDIFSVTDMFATFDESTNTVYLYLDMCRVWSIASFDITIPQRNTEYYGLTIADVNSDKQSDTFIGTEIARMSTSPNVKIRVGLDDVNKHSLPLVFDSGIVNNSTVQVYKLANVGYTASGGTDAYNLNLLLSSRGAEEIELIGGKNDSGWIIEAIRNNGSFNKITNIYQDGLDIYVRLDLRCNYFRIYHKSGVLSSDFAVSLIDTIPGTATELTINSAPIDDTKSSTTSTWSSSKIANYLNSPRYTGLISGNATVDTGWSLEQGESRKFGRLLQLDGHEGQGALSYSFIVFVKANFNNVTKVICKQIVGMYEDYDMEYTRFFELGISANKTLTIKNKSAVQTSYKFI